MTARISSGLFASITIAAGMVSGHAASAFAQVAMSCIVRSDVIAVDGRASPLDSVMFRVAGQEVKICYGRPSARGRTMLGNLGAAGAGAEMGVVPFGKVWRTGANEPTLLRTPIDLSIAGVMVPAGTYSIYTVPNEAEWEIIVNGSYSQWGQENFYTDEVRAQELGRGTAASEQTDSQVETFTIRTEESPDGKIELILEWERTRVRVPVLAGG